MTWKLENLREAYDDFGRYAVISYGNVKEHGINDDEWEWLTDEDGDFRDRLDKAFLWPDQPFEVQDEIHEFNATGEKELLLIELEKYRITTETPNYKEFDIEWV